MDCGALLQLGTNDFEEQDVGNQSFAGTEELELRMRYYARFVLASSLKPTARPAVLNR